MPSRFEPGTLTKSRFQPTGPKQLGFTPAGTSSSTDSFCLPRHLNSAAFASACWNVLLLGSVSSAPYNWLSLPGYFRSAYISRPNWLGQHDLVNMVRSTWFGQQSSANSAIMTWRNCLNSGCLGPLRFTHFAPTSTRLGSLGSVPSARHPWIDHIGSVASAWSLGPAHSDRPTRPSQLRSAPSARPPLDRPPQIDCFRPAPWIGPLGAAPSTRLPLDRPPRLDPLGSAHLTEPSRLGALGSTLLGSAPPQLVPLRSIH